jgi:outer membrane PBP1 activator LpoA protein
MNRRDAYNHLVRVYGDDKEMVEAGMKKWNEANPNSKGRPAAKSAEK